MLKRLKLSQVGLAPQLTIDWAERINLIVGDNGLGKSFLLDLAWWALTRTWAGPQALPSEKGKSPTIEYIVQGKSKKADPVKSVYRREASTWPLAAARPTMPGIVIYVRIDGGFSVWDPARNYWRTDPDRPAAYHFKAHEVWDGLDINGKRVCEGLERDWVNWQKGREEQFKALEAVLDVLSPPLQALHAGPPKRVFLGEGRDRPTLLIGGQSVPVALASAGVRRVLALAYFLVWSWHEHRTAAKLLGKPPESRVVLLIDEPETHLHPHWQRTLIPSVIRTLNVLRGSGKTVQPPQMLIATHAPLVAASIEPIFDADKDDLIQLSLKDGVVIAEQGGWAIQGDVTNWLVSETFGLEQARSLEAEKAIEDAEALMRAAPRGQPDQRALSRLHKQLQNLLPAGDPFWPRWLVKTGQIPGEGGNA